MRAKTIGRKLFLSGLILYLSGVIGFLAPTHRHEGVADSRQHQDCQLCHVSSEAYLAPVAAFRPEAPIHYVRLAERRQAHVLPARHQPFSSRGPPSA